ncbi:MAG: hypothetical protein DRQ48_00935 [Gammaproteobacteria bacterium]|nr:MAG: hypothetical protein DRQ44_00435 [Gammaproteobacteria bacterium]RKZ72244.1 MAG: hypothetical protein DRQ48_00935 [Gammaproteobacteria bacterium]
MTELEQAVLACCLRKKHLFILATSKINSSFFKNEAHGEIFEAIAEYANKNANTCWDSTLLVIHVSKLSGVGSKNITQIISAHYSESALDEYLDMMVVENNLDSTRNFIFEASAMLEDESLSAKDINTFIADGLYNIISGAASRADDPPTESEMLATLFSNIEMAQENPGYGRIPTGFDRLDKLILGYRKGTMNIIAAPSGQGKTAFALNVAANMIFKARKKVLFFSLEMSRDDLVLRIASSLSKVPSTRLELGELTDKDWEKLTSCVTPMMSGITECLRIYDSGTVTVQSIRMNIMKEMAKKEVDAVFIDYVGLIEPSDRRESRVSQVSQITREIKIMSEDFKIPIILLCQTNRNIDSDVNRKSPILSDLRESSSIGNDADTVLFIMPRSGDDWVKDFHLVKNRRGVVGDFALQFDGKTTTFINEPVY